MGLPSGMMRGRICLHGLGWRRSELSFGIEPFRHKLVMAPVTYFVTGNLRKDTSCRNMAGQSFLRINITKRLLD